MPLRTSLTRRRRLSLTYGIATLLVALAVLRLNWGNDNETSFNHSSQAKAGTAQVIQDERTGFDRSIFDSYEICCVGAGLSGAVIAERYASQLNKTVLVLEKRHHIGGNCYDYVDHDTNILVSKYGAHLFHTNHERVWQYLQQFADWMPYEHRVLANINGTTHVPVPVNIQTVNTLFGLSIQNEAEMRAWLHNETLEWQHEGGPPPTNSQEVALSRVGRRLYDLIFHGYTIKQWDKEPSELGPQVTARIPVRTNFDDRYFTDIYQALPRRGYTDMFATMLRHDRITVHTNMDYFAVRDRLKCGRTYFTGPIDAYYAHLGWDRLEYRSLDFVPVVRHDTDHVLPAAVVNYPSRDVNYTRAVEYKHFLQQSSPHTIVVYEYSKAGGEPYYPVPNPRNQALYRKYQAMAQLENNVTFVGRLANYKYFNMDESVLNALQMFEQHTKP